MWLLELLLLSLVGGTILGVSWRVIEDWYERRQLEAGQETASEVTDSEKQD